MSETSGNSSLLRFCAGDHPEGELRERVAGGLHCWRCAATARQRVPPPGVHTIFRLLL